MPVVNRSALVPYSTAQMYALVDDIQRYPEFLPWCQGAREWSRSDDEVKATLEIRRGPLQRTFTTCNRLQRNKMIEMRLVEGPFRHLEGFWRFSEIGEQASKVALDLEYEFSSGLLQLAIGPIFSEIANTLVDAFCTRARALHGS
jgi:ribosome-associated toxin RatA of RatAB toxin-antitoxin module